MNDKRLTQGLHEFHLRSSASSAVAEGPSSRCNRPPQPSTYPDQGDRIMTEPQGSSRRDFLKVSSAVAAGLAFAPNAHAAGGDTIKVGLIGCGGRGTGAI